MSTFDDSMSSAQEAYVNAYYSRDNQSRWQSFLYEAVSYASDAYSSACTPEERRNAYSKLVEIYIELGDLEKCDNYISFMFQAVPDDIIGHLQKFQVSCERYRQKTNMPRYFTFSDRAETGQTIRRLIGGMFDSKSVNDAANTLIKKAQEQISVGKLNATVYIGVLGVAMEVGVPWLQYLKHKDTVRALYSVILNSSWSNYQMSAEEKANLGDLQRKARGGLYSS